MIPQSNFIFGTWWKYPKLPFSPTCHFGSYFTSVNNSVFCLVFFFAFRSWQHPRKWALWEVDVVPASSASQTCRVPPGSAGIGSGRCPRRVSPSSRSPWAGEPLWRRWRLFSWHLYVGPLFFCLFWFLHWHCLCEVPKSPPSVTSRNSNKCVDYPRCFWQHRKPREWL